MDDRKTVKLIRSYLREGDEAKMIVLCPHNSPGWDVVVECNRRRFPAAVVGGMSCQKRIGTSRSRTTAEARAERIQKLLDKEMAKA